MNATFPIPRPLPPNVPHRIGPRPRDWAFHVQLAGVGAFYLLVATIAGWFAWRALELHRLGDSWLPAVLIGVPISLVFAFFAGILTWVFWKLGAQADGNPHFALEPIEVELLRPVLGPASWRVWSTGIFLAGVTAWGLYAWSVQLREGLGVTGLNRPVYWGLYITNFVFFIGISHAGTLISAILRLAGAEWRRAITRSAEVITVLVLFFGAWSIVLDLGRVDRALAVFQRGRLLSPLLWDVCSISTYLTASVIYLYLPLIPDVAILRDRVRGWRRPLYHLLAFGWTGAEGQRRALEKAIAAMAVVVIPIAVSVHTVVSFVFSMTLQPMWHSAIFGPYFVVGAIFSGIAALIVAMAVLRRAYGLDAWLKPLHFNHLGLLLLVMSLLWIYFTLAEHLTVFYGGAPDEMAVFDSKVTGRYAPLFWTMIGTCFVVPVVILCRARTRTVAGTVIASLSVCVGMWIERFTIVVPSLIRPRLAYGGGTYLPSWVELSLTAGAFAGFLLAYLAFTRLFPIVSLWEIREGREEAGSRAALRIGGYFPPRERSQSRTPRRR